MDIKKIVRRTKSILAHSPRPIYTLYESLHYLKEYREKGEDSGYYRRKQAKVVHHLGEKDPDKTYYVIALDDPEMGISPTIVYLLGHFRYAEKKGYIPVIDSHKYRPWLWAALDDEVQETPWRFGKPYREDQKWDYYFDPPAGVRIDEIQQCKNVVYADPVPCETPADPMLELIQIKRIYIRKWYPYFKKYISFNQRTDTYIAEQLEKLDPENKRILGVSVRMGYVQGMKLQEKHYENHYVQPDSIEVFINDLEYYSGLWHCDYIFVSSDDEGSVQQLKAHFGEKLISLERMRSNITIDGELTSNPLLDVSIESNISYLAELVILSKCTCYLGSKNGGCMIANLLNNNKFEHRYIYRSNQYGQEE